MIRAIDVWFNAWPQEKVDKLISQPELEYVLKMEKLDFRAPTPDEAVAIFVFLDSGRCDAFAPTLKKRCLFRHYMVNVLPWMLDVERRKVVKHSGPPFTLLGTGLDRLHKILA